VLITRPDGRPGWRGFPGKVFIENDSQIPQGLIGRCACDVFIIMNPQSVPGQNIATARFIVFDPV
jgi:hypothetical protein